MQAPNSVVFLLPILVQCPVKSVAIVRHRWLPMHCRAISKEVRTPLFPTVCNRWRSIALPGEQFDLVAFSIYENEYATFQYISVHLLLDDAAKCIETFPHVCGTAIPVIGCCIMDVQHIKLVTIA